MCDLFGTNILLCYVLDFPVCIPTQMFCEQEHLCIGNNYQVHIDLLWVWAEVQLEVLLEERGNWIRWQ